MISVERYFNLIKEKNIKKQDVPISLQGAYAFMSENEHDLDFVHVIEMDDGIRETVELYMEKFTAFYKEKFGDLPKVGASKAKVQKTEAQQAPKEDTDKRTAEIAFKMDIKNYRELITKKQVVRGDLPKGLQQGWDILEQVLNSDDPFMRYQTNGTTVIIDRYLRKVRDFLHECDSPKKVQKKQPTPKVRSQKKKTPSLTTKSVESVSLELKMIKRYLNLDGKTKNQNQIRLFISALQKAIRERRITKESKYAKRIKLLQSELIRMHTLFGDDLEEMKITIAPKTKEELLPIIGRETEMATVRFIKSYINLQGKIIPVEKAHNLHTRITRAFNAGKFTDKDKYWNEIKLMLKMLEAFVKSTKEKGKLFIEPRALNGLNGIVSGCGCSTSLNGLTMTPKPMPLDVAALTKQYLKSNGVGNHSERFFMSSTDLAGLEFEHVGLFGRWLDLIGDPAVGARIAVYGEPKVGKSYLMIEFAGDLAKSGKNVLYITKEEGKSATLQEKAIETSASNPNLTFTDYIPENLDDYDFVFFDSVSKCRLTPENLLAIKWAFPDSVKVEIHQVTKDGKARGLNDFIHDVDSIIHLPERGKVVQRGRYEEYSEIYLKTA